MAVKNLIGPDILLMRKRYDEALQLLGIPVTYQFPNIPDTNAQSESLVDSYSEPVETNIFFEGNPKITTFKRYGWVVENNQNLPFLLHCSFHLPHVQKDSIFRIAGQYTEVPARTFRVTEVSYDMQAPDHLACIIIPVYDDNIVGRTPVELKKDFNTSYHFLKQETDYWGEHHTTKEETKEK